MGSDYKDRVHWLQLLNEKQLLELMYDVAELETVTRIYEAAWKYIENYVPLEEIPDGVDDELRNADNKQRL